MTTPRAVWPTTILACLAAWCACAAGPVSGAASPLAGGLWRVRDVGANTDFSAAQHGAVPGLELRLSEEHGVHDGVWAYRCTAVDDTGRDRAVTLALCLPLDARGWTWWDGPQRGRVIEGVEPFSNLTAAYYGTALMASRYPLAVVSNGSTALCLAVPIEPARAVRFVYDSVRLEFRAEFDFGLSAIPITYRSRGDGAVLAYEVPAEWAFRRALARYYAIHADVLRRRAGPGGTFLTKSPLESIENPQDFGFVWHDFDENHTTFAEADKALGVASFLYREPQTDWRLLHGSVSEVVEVGFEDGSLGPLVADGAVNVHDGVATIPPDSGLIVPGLPTDEPEDLAAEFTIRNLSEIVATPTFDMGWSGRFLCGIRKSAATGDIARAGTFDFSADGVQNGEPLPIARTDSVTIKLVASISRNETTVWVGYGREARSGAHAPRLHQAGRFPWGTWTSEADNSLSVRNNSPVPLMIDDVLITRYASQVEPTYEAYRAQLYEDARAGFEDSQASLVSGVERADGRNDLYLESIAWTSRVPFGLNPDPNVPAASYGSWPNKAQYEFERYRSLLGWDASAKAFDGVFLDSMEGWGNLLNYRKQHWRTTKFPLTFDRNNGNRVCLLNLWGISSFAKALSKTLHEQGQLLMGNDAFHKTWFHMPYVDVPGREVSYYKDGAWSPPGDELYLFFRAMAARRPFWTLMNDPYDDGAHIEEYFQRSMFYGIFPSMFHAHDGKSPWYWATPAYYNRDRSLFKKYVPIIRRLDLAGWEPVPHATVVPEAVRIERFGAAASDNLAFTLHNTADASQSVALSLRLPALGIAGVQSATEWLNGEALTVASGEQGEALLALLLGPGAYAVIGLETSAQEAGG